MLALTAILIISIVDFADQLHHNKPAPAPLPSLGHAAASLTSGQPASQWMSGQPSLRSHPFGTPELQRSL